LRERRGEGGGKKKREVADQDRFCSFHSDRGKRIQTLKGKNGQTKGKKSFSPSSPEKPKDFRSSPGREKKSDQNCSFQKGKAKQKERRKDRLPKGWA